MADVHRHPWLLTKFPNVRLLQCESPVQGLRTTAAWGYNQSQIPSGQGARCGEEARPTLNPKNDHNFGVQKLTVCDVALKSAPPPPPATPPRPPAAPPRSVLAEPLLAPKLRTTPVRPPRSVPGGDRTSPRPPRLDCSNRSWLGPTDSLHARTSGTALNPKENSSSMSSENASFLHCSPSPIKLLSLPLPLHEFPRIPDIFHTVG